MSTSLHESLTPAQRAAVEHCDGPLLILAGPGSGKTRVVTHRMAHLLESGVPPYTMVALTFTNKAADEMKLRLHQLVGERARRVWMSTFHRFCAHLLRRHASLVGLSENFTIYDTADSLRALKQALAAAELDVTHATPDAIAHEISRAKNYCVPPDQYAARRGATLGPIVAEAYPIYQRYMTAANAVDFDDLLLHTVTLLKENPELRRSLDERFRYVMVDEYQDTNLAQYTIVRALSIDHPNLAVTGDPDQSIYGWRGANLNNILDFEKDYPQVRVVRLEQNYRSTQRILRAADTLIRHNERRKAKELFTENPLGAQVRLIQYDDQREEAVGIATAIEQAMRKQKRNPRDFAVFYRTNALSRSLEIALRERGIPYQIVRGVEFFQRKEIKDVLAYLQLINNPRDNVAFERIINTPPRGIGRTTVNHIVDHSRRYGLTLLEAAREVGLIEAVSKRARASVGKFIAALEHWQTLHEEPLEGLLGHVLEESGYLKHLEKSDDVEDQERLANLGELLTAAREFDEKFDEAVENAAAAHGVELEGLADSSRLEAFLEQSALTGDTDGWENETDRVTLMTLHAAKGLEFPVVFIMAVEEGLLPHERSKYDPNQLEEERRLLFVGITRAEEELQLCHVGFRAFRGDLRMAVPSSFIMELPLDDMEVLRTSAMTGKTTPMRDLMGTGSLSSDNFIDDDYSQDIEHRPYAYTLGNLNHVGDEGQTCYVIENGGEERALKPAPASKAALKLTTAADMLNPQRGKRASEAALAGIHHGAMVRHPEYGVGKVIALSGEGDKRTATVRFKQERQEKKFLLAYSHLEPVG